MFNLFKSKKKSVDLKAYLTVRFEYAPITAVNTNLMNHSIVEGTALDWLLEPVFQIKSVT